MKIYIDNTITSVSPFNTGIQRTVRNIISESINDDANTFSLIDLNDINQTKQHKPLFRIPHFISHSFAVILNKIGLYQFLMECCFKYQSIKFFNENKIKGNCYLNIDANWSETNIYFMKVFRKKGGRVISLYYDNGQFIYSQYFKKDLVTTFQKHWYKAVIHSDKIICISKTISDELKNYVSKNRNKFLSNTIPDIDYIHLGNNFKESNHKLLFNVNSIKGNKNYLVVGSIEPRKNNLLILNTFNKLLRNNKIKENVNLIFIYNNSWLQDELLESIKSSAFFNKNIFLYNDINDRELVYLFKTSYALINASYYEGYGLGIAEALNFKLKVFCSDIKTYRELYNDNAVFFNNLIESDLGKKIYFDLKSPYKVKEAKLMTWKKAFTDLINKIK